VTLLKQKFMRAVLALSAERYEESRRQRLARVVWLERLLLTWNSKEHRTLGKFLRSRAGRVFRRRCASVLDSK
jgi:hypothetical protein